MRLTLPRRVSLPRPAGSLVQTLERRQLLAVPGVSLGIYHTATQLANDLSDFVAYAPSLVQVMSIGKSVQNRDIWAIKISDNVSLEEDEPEVYYQGAMHGDEPVGQSNSMYFIDHLLSNYGTDPAVTSLVNDTEFWIVPQMNPDGFALNRRGNANNVDLNRNFPDGTFNSLGTVYDGPAMSTAGRAVETVAIMNFLSDRSITLNANFHGGAQVVNYPYDANGNGFADYAASPDDLLYRAVATEYARTNNDMLTGGWTGGITNGDDWYEVYGGLQDWTYRYLGHVATTVELWDTKKPAASVLPARWETNRQSMIDYAETAQWGIRGVVTDVNTGAPLSAKITLAGNPQPAFSDPDVGDFHRMTLPGTYTVTVQAPGYVTRTFSNVVVSASGATRLDVLMTQPEAVPPTVASAVFDRETALHAIELVFSEYVGTTFTPGDLVITNVSSGAVVASSSYAVSYDAAAKSARVAFAAPLADASYQLLLSAGGVSDLAGNANATYAYDFTMRRGDADGNGRVDFNDLLVLAQNYQRTGQTFSQGNFDYDAEGRVDFNDLLLLAQNYSTAPAIVAQPKSRKRADRIGSDVML
jgi:Zinc carboxypeptidase/Carboxypeptidase regulatory-like domain/Bacterial Ig-like domain